MLQQWIFLICAVAAFVFILVCWVWPIYRTKTLRTKDREKAAELEDDYRKTVAQVLGGAALVVGFSWTFLKDQRTLEQSLHDSAGKQFAEVAKLLDSSKSAAPSRAAGIYAFESVVNADESYSLPIQHTLIALIAAQPEIRPPDDNPPPHIASDVRAACYILGRLKPPKNNYDFAGQYLVGSYSMDAPSLVGATFRGSKLFRSDFSGADLTGAKFEGAYMSDWEAYGWKGGDSLTTTLANSTEWKLYKHVHYTTYFDRANLTDAIFDEVDLNGVHFEGATLDGTSFRGADIGRTDFTNAKALEKAHFESAHYNEPFKPQGLTDEFIKTAGIIVKPPQTNRQ
jgi:hypothetical protein